MGTVEPAKLWKRIASNSIDLSLALVVLYIVTLFQEDGPPPEGMSFYTKQQFENYFTLVFVACIFVLLNGLLVTLAPWRSTLGQLFFKIKLVCLNGASVKGNQVLKRILLTLGSVLFICLPGPIIALVIALVVGTLFQIPFSTGDEMLRSAGVSDWIRIVLHSISYLALLIAAWYVFFRPLSSALIGLQDGLTRRDRVTQSTYIDRSR